jgi:DNA repair exonuclease SbcCD ATPase subunit
MVVFDEIFDPLDAVGLDGVGELLEEMGWNRQVLVASHSERFQALIPGARVLRVRRREDGQSVVDVAA